jgi:hypothetical protein
MVNRLTGIAHEIVDDLLQLPGVGAEKGKAVEQLKAQRNSSLHWRLVNSRRTAHQFVELNIPVRRSFAFGTHHQLSAQIGCLSRRTSDLVEMMFGNFITSPISPRHLKVTENRHQEIAKVVGYAQDL